MSAPVEMTSPFASYPALEPDPEAIDKAVKLLKGAQNPMIMVGSGAVLAGEEVLALADLLQAPVVSFRGGRGVVSDEHYLGFTCAAGFKRWRETDVLIGIGSRLELQWFRWPDQSRELEIINIDIDPEQVPRIRPAVAIVGDARASARELSAGLARVMGPRSSRRQEFEAVKQATLQETRKVQPHMRYLEVIRKVLPRDGFFVEEICQAGFTSFYGFPIYEPRKFVTCGYQGTLGFGFPTALGVKVGNPDKCVVSVSGDGGFMFGLQDLATAVQYGINLVTVVFNNNAFGNVLRDQQRRFKGRVIGSVLRNPDFVALAGSFGMAGYRAETPDQLEAVLDKAFSLSAPALIEVPVDPSKEVSPWEFLMPPPKKRDA